MTLRPEASTASILERAQVLGLEFSDELPIARAWQDIAQALLEHPVLIVCGETGSGKTTQIPKIALAAGRAAKGRTIAHTQPRRIAATSVARRIAQELGSTLGEGPDATVGYKIRFNDRSRPGIPIKLMTDGILLAESQADPMLRQYDTIIIDEAHERSLNIDFLLGHLHGLLQKRSDLKLVITSATLEAAKFAKHFASNGKPAPVFEVSGRLFPVEMRWRPAADEREDLIDRVVGGIEEALDDWKGTGPGDVLVFLPGEREIRAVADALGDLRAAALSRRASVARDWDVLPLYGRLAQGDQERIFQSTNRRRVVLATNIAETSLTVPGIGYVVDTGLSRVKRYRIRGKVEQLQIEPISQAQAAQRAGRAGRLAAGVCIRLFSEADFAGRPAHPDPEIHRSSLAAVLLRMKFLGLLDVEHFAFVDPPSKRAIADGIAQLKELGAIDSNGGLSETGRQMAELPLDPRLGRMLIAARSNGCLREMMVIVAALSTQDPRERPLDQQQAADQSHRRFADERSEFKSWLKLWSFTDSAFAEKSSNRSLDKSFKAAYLSPLRVREWRDVHRQVHDWVLAQGWKENEREADDLRLHQAILTGLLSNIGVRIDSPGDQGASISARDRLWQGTHEVKFAIWPGSHLAKKPPRWLMAAEQVETSRLFARTIAAIEPEWVEAAASHLIKLSYSEPHWEKKAGRVIGYSRGTLYGLTIFQRRRVSWAQLGPQQAIEAREIMIREGLVAQEMETDLAFFRHNQKMIREVERMEQKARRQDLLVDEELLVAFYESALAPEVVDLDSLTYWWRGAAPAERDRLMLKKEDLMRHEAAGITTDQFPKQLEQSGLRLAVDYRFDPGASDDGLQLTVPLSALNQVDGQSLEWLVPGMRKDKVVALLKSLPQRIRRECLPLEQYASAFCDRWSKDWAGQGLLKALIEDISQQTGIRPALDDFRRESVPSHLHAFIRVVDEHGRLLGQGRDLAVLRDQLGEKAQQAFAPEVDETPHREWAFGELQWPTRIERAGQQLLAYPCIEDRGDHVCLTMLDDRVVAQERHARGLTRLFAFGLKEPLKSLAKDIQKNRELGLAWLGAGQSDDPVEAIAALAIRRAFLEPPWPLTAEAFAQRLGEGRSRFMLIAQEALRSLSGMLVEAQQVQKRIGALKASDAAVADIREQLGRLLQPGFLRETPDERLRHLPRYLKAIGVRLDRMRTDPARDLQRLNEWRSVADPFWRWAKGYRGEWSSEAEEFRWLLEELRVMLFAQELKTPTPVSSKRLQKSWVTLQAQLQSSFRS